MGVVAMNEAEYRAWMDDLVAQGVYSFELAEDFKQQRALFETAYRVRIDGDDRGLPGAVGFVAERPIEMESAPSLVASALEAHPGRAIYFESLGERER
jgi:hypothetical protein